MKIVRDSNLELLRLFAIFGIIIHHLLIKGASTCGYLTTYNYNTDGALGIVLNSICIGGVNCFILITGWFGIQKPIKGFVKIFFETCIFGLISYFFLICFWDVKLSIKAMIMSMDFRTNWFVRSYMMLLLISPMIERSLKDISYSQMKLWIFLLCILNFVFILYLNEQNNNGYNYINFIFLYYIGRFLKLSVPNKWFASFQKYSLLIFILMAFSLSTGYFLLYFLNRLPISIVWFGYNQPMVILLSVSCFTFFTKIKIQRRWINSFATGVFGVFILHTTPLVIPIRDAIANSVFHHHSYWGLLVMGLILFIVCIFVSLPISKATALTSQRIYGIICDKIMASNNQIKTS